MTILVLATVVWVLSMSDCEITLGGVVIRFVSNFLSVISASEAASISLHLQAARSGDAEVKCSTFQALAD